MRTATVAGIPVRHEPSDAAAWPVPWRGDPTGEAPLTIRHAAGTAAVGDAPVLMEMPPWATYHRGEHGRTLVRFHAVTPGCPAQLVRPLDDAGEVYEVLSEHEPPADMVRWDRDLAVVMMALATRQRGLVAHGCGFLLPDGTAVLCPAVSGTGKSTLARLLEESGSGARVLNDDRLVITAGAAGPHLWSTPWPGSNGRAVPGDGPLRALILLGRATEPRWRDVAGSEVIRQLTRTVALPVWDRALLPWSLDLLGRVLSECRVAEYAYPPAVEAARTLVDALCSPCLTP